jgi:hypothetical protein
MNTFRAIGSSLSRKRLRPSHLHQYLAGLAVYFDTTGGAVPSVSQAEIEIAVESECTRPDFATLEGF